jgi:MinD-like ATPase involved in chromosome partitioning or flagellar assembly
MNNAVQLRQKLDEQFAGNYELDVGADKTAIVLVIDASFSGQTRAQRLQRVEPMLQDAGLRTGITDLYTPDEAKEMGITLTPPSFVAPATWDDAVSMIESGLSLAEHARTQGKPRRIVFYSYKGGVGRTTALVHTAFHLARSGARVVVADMDVEAPGLHAVLPRPDGQPITAGLVDYLWERQVRPFDPDTEEGLETCLVEVKKGQRNAISYAVEDPVSRAQIHVIPAGVVGPDFVRRLHTLSYQDVLTRADDAWSLFEKELIEQLEPDILLIDARTGLGDWGGLSLLRLADEAFLVLYPSDQNIEGLRFVRQTIRDLTGINTHLVLSPVPEGVVGRELMARFRPQLGLEEDEQCVEIHYNPGIASAPHYPLESAMPNYARLANLIRETEVEDKLEVTLKNLDRWPIIESLTFPERDAKTIAAGNFDAFFQKTSDFDKFLDDARWVVRGRKGTGKSTLFHLFVEHPDNAIKRAKGKLEHITILPGHGPTPGAAFRPTTDEFGTIQRELEKERHDWLSLWRAYAIVRIFTSDKDAFLESGLKKAEMKKLRTHLQNSFRDKTDNSAPDRWRSNHTTALLAMLHDPFNGLCRDLMGDLNKELGTQGKKLWLLYDDLDQDIQEARAWQGDALGGLLRLAYDANNSDLHNIRFKVFLREDIWSKLVFTNKSHFGEPRTLLLQWKIDDFLRLAYRLATGGSKKFHALAMQCAPLSDNEVDSASEEQLRQALAPLWGMNQEKNKNAFAARWVYARMTDAKDNTYPRSLTVLLNKARDQELEGKNSGKAVASDRLLSRPAMQAGLIAASVERVNALKNEYPNVIAFLENVQETNSLPAQFSSEELAVVWQATSQNAYPTFEAFVAQLMDAGLLIKKNGKSYDYGFATLYIDKLGVKRVSGEKK